LIAIFRFWLPFQPKIVSSMKRIVPAFVALLFAACGLFFWQKNEKPLEIGLKMPSGASEENGKLRRAWDLKRLADPATGRIPAGIAFLERQFAAALPQAVAARSEPDWQSRGPYNYGGRTRALVADVNDENRLLAGGVSGGIWLSEDGGQSWQRKTPLNAHPGCVSIAQDTRPGHTDTWYYLSGEVYGTSASGGSAFYLGDGMFKSTDGGDSWFALGSTAIGNPNGLSTLFQLGWRVVTDPNATEEVLYMANLGAIHRSNNGGTSWAKVLGGTVSNFAYFTDVAISPTSVLYASVSTDGPQGGIWRSTNGTNWVNIKPDTSAGFPPAFDRFVIGISPDNENEVYFFGSTPGYGHLTTYIDSEDWTSLWKYTYLSGDGAGANGVWQNLSQNLPSAGTQFDQCAAQGGYDLVVKVQPGTGHVFIGGTNLWRSTDGFATADNTTKIGGYKIGTELPFFEIYPEHHPDVHDLMFLPSNPNVLLSASDGGLHRTEDCLAPFVEWSRLNNGYQTTQFYTAILDKNAPGDPTLIGGLQDNGNFFVNSADGNALWRQTVNGDGAYGAVAPGKAYYVLSIQQGRVAKVNLDAAGNVLAFRRIDPIGPAKSDYQFINPLVLDPHDANVLYLPAGNRLWRQDSLGAIALTGVWDSIAQGWTQFPNTFAGIISAIAVSESNPADRVFIGTENNKIYRIENARSASPTVTQLTSPVSNSAAYVTCLAIDPENADRVLLTFSNYGIYSLYESTNAGQNWRKVAGNLEQTVSGSGSAPSLRWVSILPFPDGSRKYFCGTSVGLFSADSLLLHASGQPGTQWVLEGADVIGSAVVSYVGVRAADGLVAAATHGSGMFSANFEVTIGTQEPSAGAPVVRVSPNPARDFAVFDFMGQNVDNVQVRLFDLRGNLLREARFSGEKGTLRVGDFPSGIYLWEMRARGWRRAGKLLRE
jgi:hypothetical protein